MRATSVAVTVIGVLTMAAVGGQQRPMPAPPPGPPPLPMPAILQRYQPVTAERLLKPADGEWLMIRRTYDGWGYSPLDQITAANVAQLKPVWVFSTGAVNGHEAPPLVNNGVMFVSTPGNQVIAVDARSGTLLWRYRLPIPDDAVIMHPTTRGVALYGDKVYLAANQAVLVALDARTGREVWTVNVAENQHGYYMTLAPMVAEGRVMIGASGGEFGVRGFVAAYDAETGKPAWKTYMVPAPGEPGSETWPKGDQWKTGGASVWVTGNYDPETRLAFWGTGNGGPWMGDQRPGDNLYTASTVALDVRTGRIMGHHQYHPNDSWDWDEVSPPNPRRLPARRADDQGADQRRAQRLPVVPGAQRRQDLVRAGDALCEADGVSRSRPGHRASGRRSGSQARHRQESRQHLPVSLGRQELAADRLQPEDADDLHPRQRQPLRLHHRHPGRVPTRQPLHGRLERVVAGARRRPRRRGAGVARRHRQEVWTHPYPTSATWGSMLATAGGLVFSGGTNDRKLRAFDAATGKVLWEFPTNSGILAPPSSYTIDGQQYIAVQSGWGIDSRLIQSRLNTLTKGAYPEVPEGGAIWVFALP